MNFSELIPFEMMESWSRFVLGKYSDPLSYHKTVDYLKRYYLSLAEFDELVKPTFDSTFLRKQQIREQVFLGEREFFIFNGGTIFLKNEFDRLKKLSRSCEENSIYLYPDLCTFPSDTMHFAFRFPHSSTFEDITSDEIISPFLFGPFDYNYFVFGDSGKWGYYTANMPFYLIDGTNAFNILGVEFEKIPLVLSLFHFYPNSNIEDLSYIPKEERPNLIEQIPTCYL